MQALVTGGAGFIGHHLVKSLIANSASVRVVDDLSTGLLPRVPRPAETIQSSILDGAQLTRAAAACDVIFHLAAFVSVPASCERPEHTMRVNVEGTTAVLEAARKADIKNVVFSSSCAVYGNGPEQPKREDATLDIRSPYALSKKIGEEICDAFGRMYGIRTVALRYFNVYGRGQDPNGPYAAVVPKFIDAARANRDLLVYGNGKQSRDFIHVSDVVQANLIVAQRGNGGTYNVGSGVPTSIRGLAERIAAMRPGTRIRYELARAGDIQASCSDSSKLHSLGWQPCVDLTAGLRALLGS